MTRRLDGGSPCRRPASGFARSGRAGTTDAPPRPRRDHPCISRKRILLLGVAVLLTLSALLAIGILLVGRFGSVEGRILGSTALLAGYGLVALPAMALLDTGRSPLLARSAGASAALGYALTLASIWSGSDSAVLGRAVGSATIVALALAQTAALTAALTAAVTARRSGRDRIVVRRLFVASCGTAALVSALALTMLWAGGGLDAAARFVGALLVLDLLLVALQPLVARTRAGDAVRRFTVVTATGERVELEIVGGDTGSAAARAIRSVEHGGGAVVALQLQEVGTGAEVASVAPDASSARTAT